MSGDHRQAGILALLPAMFLRLMESNVSTPAKEKAPDHATFDAFQVGTSGNPVTSPRHIRPTDEGSIRAAVTPERWHHSKYTNKDCDSIKA
ncbi:hypothetical protein HYQ46_001795 [Verticillium longisporum]|nr:hypothetical protein HYQ44_001687 [Verticillium longisporum]KAG7149301.1 hypothetical protein HYQ46_001795 [Verticillium longisporum]